MKKEYKKYLTRPIMVVIMVVICLLIISGILTVVIPGDIHKIVSDLVKLEGSGMIINFLAIFIILIIAYWVITNAHAKTHTAKSKTVTDNFGIIGRNRTESDKKRDMYKEIKQYLSEVYLKELIIAFDSAKINIGKIRLISMLLELQNKGEFNPNINEEDDNLLQFFKKFHSENISKMYESRENVLKGEGTIKNGALEIRMSKQFNDALIEIEKKIEEFKN